MASEMLNKKKKSRAILISRPEVPSHCSGNFNCYLFHIYALSYLIQPWWLGGLPSATVGSNLYALSNTQMPTLSNIHAMPYMRS